ncbi:uncharacterized protein LOC127751537 [Frankliniella occidentalis]|uniref:Uncharacterized protein LOC127751537 n=1 Tax=Frankliniella occidentalis TaxID=133901 RepID=A0A9C6XUD1_FRAOC|nr:uncharacterized protein LOC127751537 [Frankliniella occidentalis]
MSNCVDNLVVCEEMEQVVSRWARLSAIIQDRLREDYYGLAAHEVEEAVRIVTSPECYQSITRCPRAAEDHRHDDEEVRQHGDAEPSSRSGVVLEQAESRCARTPRPSKPTSVERSEEQKDGVSSKRKRCAYCGVTTPTYSMVRLRPSPSAPNAKRVKLIPYRPPPSCYVFKR